MAWVKRSTPTDTGWLDVSADLRSGATGTLQIRREGLTVWWRVKDLVSGSGHAFYWPPAGLAAPSDPISLPPQTSNNPEPFYLDGVGRICRKNTAASLASDRWWEGCYLLPAGTPPLTTYPGEEVS